MSSPTEKTVIATRGSALALAQSNMIKAQCEAAIPGLQVEIKIIKTTGDKLQTASLANLDLPKGLFTKELETALLNANADFAVHSLKDLPTELPSGLVLGAVSKRADVRDVLIYRDANSGPKRGFRPHLKVADLPQSATVATSSNRRKAQLLEKRPDLNLVPIRGNVPTRLKKLAEQPELDAIILAAAGLQRLHYVIDAQGTLKSESLPPGLLATFLDPEEMLPCVGQAAIGIEMRTNDPRIATICQKLNDAETFHCVTAERAFLQAMGGGCQLAVAALAEIVGGTLRIRGVSFLGRTAQRAEIAGPVEEARELGKKLAAQILSQEAR